jgi:hypothetical protein
MDGLMILVRKNDGFPPLRIRMTVPQIQLRLLNEAIKITQEPEVRCVPALVNARFISILKQVKNAHNAYLLDRGKNPLVGKLPLPEVDEFTKFLLKIFIAQHNKPISESTEVEWSESWNGTRNFLERLKSDLGLNQIDTSNTPLTTSVS